ncbi:MAG: hypothetical protein RLZZ584_354, partial [Pseudomonadota bacterium]
DAGNSLVGRTALDQVGSGGITALANGHYVVSSPGWDGAAVNVGAVSWGNGSGGSRGVVGTANSLTGSTANDSIGSGGVTALGNGNYVVASPLWDGAAVNVGAATWVAGGAAFAGAVGAGNSLTGSSTNDGVGSGGVTALSNGHYVVASPDWSAGQGAVTWRNGSTGGAAVVGVANSLVGTAPDDHVGSGGVTALTNGNYVVASPQWDGAVVNAGAVTWSDGSSGRGGVLRAADALTGSTVNDRVGSGGVTALAHGDYVVASPGFNNGTLVAAGAVTAGQGAGGSSGSVASANSQLGATTNDRLGSGGITALTDGSYVIASPDATTAGKVKAGSVLLASVADGRSGTRIDALAPTGTTLTVQAGHDITVAAAAAVDGALVFDAGHRITLDAPVSARAAGPAALVMSSGDSFVNHAGAGALLTPAGDWQVWSVDPAADVRGGLVYDFKQFDATYGATTVLGSGKGLLYKVAPLITPQLGGTATKVYDGNTTAPQDRLVLGASGAIDGDSVKLAAAAANYASPNAGTGIAVTAGGLTLSASNGSAPVYGYRLATPAVSAAGTGTILQALLDVRGSVAASKVYDGGTTARLATPGRLVGLVGADQVQLSQSASFADRNVGTAKPVGIVNSLTGPDAANYRVDPGSSAADITPLALGVSPAVAAGKVYDGGTAAALLTSGVLSGVLAGDVVSLGQSASFADRNVGTAKPVNIDNRLSGPDSANYSVAAGSSTADITPRPISVAGSVAGSKVYDGGTAAGLRTPGTLVGVIGGDQVTLDQSASFADKNVGTAKPVAIANHLGGRDGANYSAASSLSEADITPRALDTSPAQVNSKVYDASTAATLAAPGALVGLIAGDQVRLDQSASFADRNVGTAKPVSIDNRLSGADALNYSVAAGRAVADITPRALTASPAQAADKVYDASTAASLVTPGTLVGVLAGDVVTLGQSASFADRNVGTGKAVSIANTLGGRDAANYSVAAGSSQADITPRTLGVSGSVAESKVYDAGAAAGLSTPGTLGGVISGDVVTLGQTARFADKNVGSAKLVAIANTLDGVDARNYRVADSSAVADITPRPLDVIGTLAADKTYDAGTAATLTRSGSLAGVLGGDAVALKDQSGVFVDRNAGVGKTVQVTSTVQGADAGNYVVRGATTQASITPLTLDVTGAVTTANKVYDGTLDARIAAGSVLAPALVGDQVALRQSASFVDKNVGTARVVQVNSTLAGTDAANYSLRTSTSQSSADITPRDLTVTGTLALDRAYDGTTLAQLKGPGVMSGLVAGDLVSLRQGASFADRNVGTAKQVAIANAISGIDASNYTLTNPAAQASASITPRVLEVLGTTVQGKVYDSTTSATLARAGTLTGVIAGENVVLAGQSASFVDKQAGSARPVTISNTISGTGVGNYTVRDGRTTADITPRQLGLSGSTTALDKVYDGTRVAALDSTAALTGVLAGDLVALSQAGSFTDHVVGADKRVTVANNLRGVDAANYVVASGSSQASITPRLGSTGTPLPVALDALAGLAPRAAAAWPARLDLTVHRSEPMAQILWAEDERPAPSEVAAPVQAAAAPAAEAQVAALAQPAPAPAEPPPPAPEMLHLQPGAGAQVTTNPVTGAVTVTVPGDVLFDFNQSSIKPDARAMLDRLAGDLGTKHAILVVGHTDSMGGVDFNQRLSVRRAEAVRNFLVERGLPAGNVTIRGEGKLKPVAGNATATGRSRNRRVEIVVQ